VANIQKQQEAAGKSRAALEKEREKALREKQKAEDEKHRKEEAALLRPVQVQKIPFGVDPKTVLCAFYKAGTCDKGNKCKFSHNPDVERKVEKRNLYDDTREQDKSADTMETWDEEKLRNVVLSKHGNPRTTTDIVCKYFIDAIETQKWVHWSPLHPPTHISSPGLGGSGNVRMGVKSVNTGTLSHRDSFSNLSGRL